VEHVLTRRDLRERGLDAGLRAAVLELMSVGGSDHQRPITALHHHGWSAGRKGRRGGGQAGCGGRRHEITAINLCCHGSVGAGHARASTLSSIAHLGTIERLTRIAFDRYDQCSVLMRNISLDTIRAATSRIYGVVARTPLIRLDPIDRSAPE